MEKLMNGQPGRHECWEELAEHSLTHDDLPRLVDLGGVEYERRECGSCDGTGERYDPTLADNIHTRGSGMIRCPQCRDSHEPGYTYTITSRGLSQEAARREVAMR